MGFGEAGREKSVVIADVDAGGTRVRTLPVPVFRPLERIDGDWPAVAGRLAALVEGGGEAWIDVEYTGEELLPDLHARVSGLVEGSALTVVKIGNRKLARLALAQNSAEETLDDLDPAAVFDRCLDAHGIADSERGELRRSYAEILHTLQPGDPSCE
jgi:exonuclease SbcD